MGRWIGGHGQGEVAYLGNYHYLCNAIRLEGALWLLLFYLYTRKYD